MSKQTRRRFLASVAKVAGATTVGSALPTSLQRAAAIPAHTPTGTIADIAHIVVLTQENRSFDHYFGTMAGVRGFADPFPIPVPNRPGLVQKTVWYQPRVGPQPQSYLLPFRADTTQHWEYNRLDGTPHGWHDAQEAWNHGRLNACPLAKKEHAMAYFAKEDIPFQWELASTFTICDAYHCAMHAGTNPNRLFIWTGSNDPSSRGNGPALYNEYEWFDADPGRHGGYTWTTYPERLTASGVSWQVYQAMEDNYTDNPLAGFHSFRAAWFKRPGYSEELRSRGVTTRDLDLLKQDVLADKLPQVSWVVATAEGSEHPSPSSPAQGAAYSARVLDALRANPEVWSKTVFLINFDENDGYFDYVPPPAPPSCAAWHADPTQAVYAGASTVDTTGEYHAHVLPYYDNPVERSLLGRPYGLGPRVPLYVISPWSKGGWVNSQVFDHTSIIRLIEARFGVHEPNISAWRRAVCGDLTSTLDFRRPDAAPVSWPATVERAAQVKALPSTVTPPTPGNSELPTQEIGVRPSRALPYELQIDSRIHADGVELHFINHGTAGAVFHVYNRLDLQAIPRRYTVEAGKGLAGAWHHIGGAYDLWVIAPNGFHRAFSGKAEEVGHEARLSRSGTGLVLQPVRKINQPSLEADRLSERSLVGLVPRLAEFRL